MLAELALRDRPVALIASDQRMPEHDRHRDARAGPAARARREAPAAHRVRRHRRRDQGDQRHRARLLPAQAVGPARGAALPGHRRPARATGSGAPARTPADVRVVGHRWSERSHEIKTFLARNHVPYRWLDVERDDEAAAAAGRSPHADGRRPPAGARPRRRDAARRRRPSTSPSALGLRTRAEQPLYDLCIVGGGPAGLAAAVYAASEGLQHRRRRARGARRAGRAERGDRELPRASRRGCPAPTSPHRAVAQAARFGAEMVLARDVVGVRDARAGARRALRRAAPRSRRAPCSSRPACPTAGSRRPGSTSSPAAASTTARRASEASQCEGDDVYVVGAANSAGQAALNLARYAKRVVLLVRGGRARGQRCRTTSSTRIRADAEHRGAAAQRGRRRPRRRATSRRSRSPTATRAPTEEVPTSWLFVFIGASPRTDWLGADVARDEQGLRRHRAGPARRRRTPRAWPLARGAVRARDQRARRVRGRRRAAGLDEAGRVRRRRGRDGGLPRPPLPGDDLMRRSTTCAPLDPVRRAHRRAAAELVAAGDEVRVRRPATSCSARASPPTSGGCWSTGASTCVRHVGREETVRRHDGRARPVGRRVPRLGRRTASTSRPARASTPAACCGCRRAALRDLVERLVPVRRRT